MDAARRRFPEFDKWRQVNLTLDVPYKPCKATKKYITSYRCVPLLWPSLISLLNTVKYAKLSLLPSRRHGDHIAIIPSAPEPSFAYGMKNLGNLRLLAGEFKLPR